MLCDYPALLAPLSAGTNRPFNTAFRVALMILILAGFLAGMVDSAMAGALGPDTQPTPGATQRYTDVFGIIGWGILFSILSVVLPILGFFVMLGAAGGIFTGGVIYGFSEQIRLGRPLNGMDAAMSGLVSVLATIGIYLFAGPFGLYHWTVKPLLIRADQADATLCCLSSRMPPDHLSLSRDGRWLLAHHSEPLAWGAGDREAAGRAYLVDTKAGAFVRFPGPEGDSSAFWRIGHGVKKVGFLHDVSWDVADGRYLLAKYEVQFNKFRWEKFDLQRLGLGPVRVDQPMPQAPENFQLLSYSDDGAVFQSSKRRIELPVGGESISLDASGTVAAVVSYDEESWSDSGTIAFWHLPSGQRIREYKVNYLPAKNPDWDKARKNPTWHVAYGGAVWLYVAEEHVKIFRPMEGWSPSSARQGSGQGSGLLNGLAAAVSAAVNNAMSGISWFRRDEGG